MIKDSELSCTELPYRVLLATEGAFVLSYLNLFSALQFRKTVRNIHSYQGGGVFNQMTNTKSA